MQINGNLEVLQTSNYDKSTVQACNIHTTGIATVIFMYLRTDGSLNENSEGALTNCFYLCYSNYQ